MLYLFLFHFLLSTIPNSGRDLSVCSAYRHRMELYFVYCFKAPFKLPGYKSEHFLNTSQSLAFKLCLY